jgi:hypothetical protein
MGLNQTTVANARHLPIQAHVKGLLGGIIGSATIGNTVKARCHFISIGIQIMDDFLKMAKI